MLFSSLSALGWHSRLHEYEKTYSKVTQTQGVIVSSDNRLFLPLNPTHWTFSRKHRILDKTQEVEDNKT